MALRKPIGAEVRANTPMHAYSPGTLSQLTPEQRGKALKRTKRVKVDPALTRTILS